MSPDSDAQQRVVEHVEQVFEDKAREALVASMRDAALQLWRDFAEEDVSRTRKPETWAAALMCTVARLQVGNLTQEETADWFDVSAITGSQKYRQIADVLDLVLLDERYVPEGQQVAFQRQYPSAPDDLPLLEAPTDPWLFSFRPPAEKPPSEAAQELVYDGWDALGVLAYELLTGTRPFGLIGKRPSEMERIVTEEPPNAPMQSAPRRATTSKRTFPGVAPSTTSSIATRTPFRDRPPPS